LLVFCGGLFGFFLLDFFVFFIWVNFLGVFFWFVEIALAAGASFYERGRR
jgi:hypothetical protein